MCRKVPAIYLCLFTIITAAAGAIITFKGSFWRIASLSCLTILVLFLSYAHTAKELSDIRTYTYESFIITFYLWLALIVSSFIATILFPVLSNKITKSVVGITLIFSVFFVFTGRGGSEHIYPIIGGLLDEISWKSLRVSAMFIILASLPILALILAVVNNVAEWIATGKIESKSYRKLLKQLLSFVLIMLIPVLSLPPAILLNNNDVQEAKVFIEKIIPKLQEYQKQKGEYPRALSQAVPELGKSPRLIDRHEYFVFGVKGSYYFSRPDKYCLIFQDPGKDFGYHTITSQRDWKFITEKASLENSYISLCDEDGPTSHEGMLSTFLGLSKPDDPFGKLSLEINKIARPAITAESTGNLKETLSDLAKDNPEMLTQPDGQNRKPMSEEEIPILYFGPMQPNNVEELLDNLKKNTEAEIDHNKW